MLFISFSKEKKSTKMQKYCEPKLLIYTFMQDSFARFINIWVTASIPIYSFISCIEPKMFFRNKIDKNFTFFIYGKKSSHNSFPSHHLSSMLYLFFYVVAVSQIEQRNILLIELNFYGLVSMNLQFSSWKRVYVQVSDLLNYRNCRSLENNTEIQQRILWRNNF